ncbi:hypothetical protein C8R44DRAFT_758978 [Mycena epipterygia]|nr:hypothetical protein C8R44DRAFT_758978 [Mycena epipterygia]
MGMVWYAIFLRARRLGRSHCPEAFGVVTRIDGWWRHQSVSELTRWIGAACNRGCKPRRVAKVNVHGRLSPDSIDMFMVLTACSKLHPLGTIVHKNM